MKDFKKMAGDKKLTQQLSRAVVSLAGAVYAGPHPT